MNHLRKKNMSICQECKLEDCRNMVQCDNCDKWSHYRCVGVGQEIENYQWLCKRCNTKTSEDYPLETTVRSNKRKFLVSSRHGENKKQRSSFEINAPTTKGDLLQRNPIKHKSLEEKRIDKLESELKSVKDELLRIESEKDQQIAKLGNELKTLQEENVLLKYENEGFNNLKAENDELNKMNKHLLSLIEKAQQIDSSAESNGVENAINESLAEDKTGSRWIKIVGEKEFANEEMALKKSKEAIDQLVNYIEDNIFEDTIHEYVQQSMKVLFKKRFFLNQISFKYEKGRVRLKNTKILQCLEKTIEKKFPKEVQEIESPRSLTGLIREIISNFKVSVRRNPSLWVEEEA